MDILFLNHNVAWSGGTFFRAVRFARELVRLGHRVTLLSIAPTARFRMTSEFRDGVEVVYTPDWFWGRGRSGWDPWDTLRRVLRIRGRRWDIVHAWDSRPAVVLPALAAAAQSRRSGGRLVMDWCDWWGRGGTQTERTGRWIRAIAPIETFFEERFRALADGTTVISGALRERSISLGVDPRRILSLPQGCDAPSVTPAPKEVAQERVALPPGNRLLVSVGALNRSDATLLFNSVRAVLRARPDCHFALIGRHGADVPPDLSAHPRFRETGFVSSGALNDYMAASDALLVPLADTAASRARWPSKVNGFLTAGRATVITRVGDLAQLLEREAAAVVVEPSESSIVAGVLRLLESPEERDRIQRAAQRVAEGVLAWPTLTSRLEAFYGASA